MLLLLEAAHDDVGDVVVEPGKDLRQAFEDRHLASRGRRTCWRTRSRWLRRRSTTPPGHVVEHQHFVAGHDRTRPARSRGWCAARSRRRGPRCVAGERRRRAVRAGDRHGAIRPEAADAFEDRDLLRLHEAGQALDDAIDDLLLAGLRRDEVDDGRAGLDAELGGVGDVALHRGGLEERLGRDAAAVEAGAAHLVHLDDGDVEAGRRGVQRCAVSARSTADHDEIEFGCGLHGGSVTVVSRPESWCRVRLRKQRGAVATVAPSRPERAPIAAVGRPDERSVVETFLACHWSRTSARS